MCALSYATLKNNSNNEIAAFLFQASASASAASLLVLIS